VQARSGSGHWICGDRAKKGYVSTDRAVFRVTGEHVSDEGPDDKSFDCTDLWSDGDEVWVLGSNELWHLSGELWETETLPPHDRLQHLSGSSREDVWLIDDKGALFHFDGRVWKHTATAFDKSVFTGVFAVAPGDAWAWSYKTLDNHTVVLHWDGTRWNAVDAYGFGVGGGAGQAFVLGQREIRRCAR
jgi:hypothetical protein